MRTHKVTSLSIEPELLEAAKKRVELIRPKTTFSAYIQQLIEMDLENHSSADVAVKSAKVVASAEAENPPESQVPIPEKVKAGKGALKAAKRKRLS